MGGSTKAQKKPHWGPGHPQRVPAPSSQSAVAPRKPKSQQKTAVQAAKTAHETTEKLTVCLPGCSSNAIAPEQSTQDIRSPSLTPPPAIPQAELKRHAVETLAAMGISSHLPQHLQSNSISDSRSTDYSIQSETEDSGNNFATFDSDLEKDCTRTKTVTQRKKRKKRVSFTLGELKVGLISHLFFHFLTFPGVWDFEILSMIP